MPGKLETYHQKRRFNETPEPSGEPARMRASGTRTPVKTAKTARSAIAKATGKVAGKVAKKAAAKARSLSFVIQEHHARRLHYDFRLELDGTLKSWAVPKGPSLDPSVKRLAVHVEDHPLEYGSFEGEIPPGNYGAGSVIVWDRGTWSPTSDGSALAAYQAGKLKFTLNGEKLHGGWTLVRSHMKGSGDKEQWLLIKERDDEAHSEAEFDVLEKSPGSVLQGSVLQSGVPDRPRRPASARTGTTTRAGKESARKEGTKKGITQTSHEVALTRSTTTLPSLRGKDTRKSSRPDIVSTRSAESLRELAGHPAIKGAVKAALPAAFKPQLATLVDTAPSGNDWSYEIKFDGYRVLVRVDTHQGKPRVRILTRAGNDWTAKFGRLANAFAELGIESGWLDGEAVVLDKDGLPDFQALQNAFDVARPQDIVIYLFDVPFLNGYDLRDVPLVQRRAILHALLEDTEPLHLRFSEDFAFSADDLLKSACAMALEGIIGKRLDSPYTSRRSPAWIKLKCRRRQEFVIGGYSEPSGSRSQFGALLLGVHDAQGKLQYAGRVGSGFNADTLRTVRTQLDRYASDRMPFAKAPSERSRTPVHWVEPKLVAECNFAEWTDERIVRQASFVSLRDDKPAKQIVKEAPVKGATVQTPSPQDTTSPRSKSRSGSSPSKVTPRPGSSATETATKPATKSRSQTNDNTIAGVKISHPDRIIDKQSQTRKIDLVRYYESVAQRMLTELKDRPLALVRAPDDIGGELFFQKHSQRLSIPGVTQHPGLDPGHPALMTLDTVEALVGAAQMGTVELHTWNALAATIEKPDRMVFDLDPDPALGWSRMVEAAQLTRTLLEELGLTSFCKTSGGKGLHVVVPLAKQADWDEVRTFAQGIAQHMATTLPDHFSAKMGPQNRKKKIFIDYLRNNRGSTTVAAFSARARPGLGVSVPLTWDELPDTTAGDQWNIANVHERLDSLKTDPWAAYSKTRQRLSAAMKKRLDLDKAR
jgi:bifunctional non-homologous end joining protein LigD